jgi:pimeloyl-ACP methyl ester carboxylesterase
MHHRFLSYRDSTISYYCYGSGPEKIFCFHGYGEDGRVYQFLEPLASARFTFYSIELPFHGNTIWKESHSFQPGDLIAIVDLLMPVGPEKISLLGFSLGGRIALGLFEAIPERVKKMILLAPDGLKLNFWYWLSTQTRIGNKIFAWSMQRPGGFFSVLKFAKRFGIVNASIFKFVNYYIGNPRARADLYRRWTGLRKFRPDIANVKKLIRTHEVKMELVYGRHDRIILSSRGEKFQKGIAEFCRVTVIDAGHQVLHKNHNKTLMEVLLR